MYGLAYGVFVCRSLSLRRNVKADNRQVRPSIAYAAARELWDRDGTASGAELAPSQHRRHHQVRPLLNGALACSD